jgi:hypothetical protein
MQIDDEKIKYAVSATQIVRAPKQNLYTFGTTNIAYFLLSQPSYTDSKEGNEETVVREGKVIAERPRIVTPYYLSRLEGFGTEARQYFESLLNEYGPNTAGVFYTYKNEPKDLNIVSNSLPAVVAKINADIDQRGDTLSAIIQGVDTLWDVSLLKFIFELTRRSLGDNVEQMGQRGLLKMDTLGIPGDARMRIEEMFRKVSRGEIEPRELRDELERWHLFEEYEDRFFALFGKGK